MKLPCFLRALVNRFKKFAQPVKPKYGKNELKDYIDNLITLNAKVAPDGTLLLVNETAASYLHKRPDELVGQKIWDTPWWNYDPQVIRQLQHAVQRAASGQTVYYEAKNLIGQDKYIYIDFTLNPVLNENNEILYLVAEGRDITERKLMEQDLMSANQELVAINEELVAIEEELRNSNEEIYRAHQKLYHILETITDAFIALNHNWEINYVNSEAEKLLSIKKAEVIGSNLWQLFPQLVDTFFYKRLHRVQAEQVNAHFDFYYLPGAKWFNIHAYPSPDGIFIYFHDVTPYKQAQEKLYQQNQYLTSLHETALALMNRLDPDELLAAIAARAASLLGTEHGWIYLANTDRSAIVLRLGIGIYKKYTGFRLQTGEGLSGKVWQTGKPLIVDDYSTWPGRSLKFDCPDVRGAVAVPLKTGQEVIGVIGIGFVEKTKKMRTEHLNLLTGFAQLASIALDNARLYNAAQQELAERRRMEEILLHMAYHDALTDLPNRSLFNDRLAVAIAQAARHKKMLAVIFLDLDYFKVVNDTLGHDMGDLLLKGIAHRLTSLLRQGDTIARIGGDEFTILLNDINRPADASRVAQKIIDNLQEPWVIGNHEFHITTSIGIAIYPTDGRDVETLVKNADAAMYHAKEAGRNNFQFYTPAMNDKSLQRLELENNLRRALERDEFVVYYQPQVEIATGKIIGAEALVRWQHPHLGMIPPGQFIPVAEDTGLIIAIGEKVLRMACTQNKAWQDGGLPPIRVAVNLSPRQFLQQNFVDKVAQILKDTGMSPRWLELEITESLAMKDVELTEKTLLELRRMGITIAIDDFGTGYSSLSYLKRLPIDTIKIDRSFVWDLSTDPDDTSIVSTIIILAHNLKMKVVAEGVETQEQLNILRQQHCDGLQGYLFSGPLPPDELARLLAGDTGINITH
ncbi:EAL domain-containing protein [Desulforamulus hydrothermalis]|uniref:Diguanylate cyclase/phosphodiesterase with PAS/PAC and GAF sensor(S) n=1 Tax=Desulforamulus hydrothermalis Lam5 = DSM 18033 TaxID=1121428 RepID=K8DXN2_9FIRM|nr:EAL domain-containing protein [Desulforamulus hydrothermalis]CCO07442.1 Diguanylate cyclase/phosphodiesterase with PAS/PAC and GAF sensor(S) [Desulforamulus hydrothermalis Lam5 = DSM 18033]SHH18388.1 PAS domain S-box-containing protein/diguanylate cyclase (GGDEF) domain-containing protein [Desulforamulus hydrothermalis Lam5 = DSM 18033]